MQNGSPLENGDPSHLNDHDETHRADHEPPLNDPETRTPYPVNGQVFVENADHHSEQNGSDSPPLKKRKLTDPSTRKSTGLRPISPPWKKIAVEGPTSFIDEGRRKSSRTNYVPIELQPPADKRQTRGAVHQNTPFTKSKYGGAYRPSLIRASNTTQTHNHVRRSQSVGRPAANGVVAKSPVKSSQNLASTSKSSDDTLAPSKRSNKKKTGPLSPPASELPHTPKPDNAHQIRRKARTSGSIPASDLGPREPRNGWHSMDDETDEHEEPVKTTPGQRPQRLSLKVRMPTVNVQHPAHVLPPRKHDSFQEWFEKEGRLGLIVEEPDPHMTDQDAIREARLRTRIAEAAKHDGLLSEARCQFYKPEPIEPHSRLYTHQDRLLAHAVYFKKLMDQERNKHRKNAKECAEKVAAFVRLREEEKHRKWKQAQPKTEEDIVREREEEAREVYSQVLDDIKQKWMMVTQLVEKHRMQRWEEEQERLEKAALNEVIEKSTDLLDRRRTFRESTLNSGDESDEGYDSHGEESRSDSSGAEEDESNMSSSDSESEEGQSVADDDAALTQEELRRKYARAAELNDHQSPEPDSRAPDTTVIDTDRETPEMTEATAPADAQENPASNVTTAAGGHESPPTMYLEEVPDALIDDTDASTDMNSDQSESDESSEVNSSEEEESEDEPQGLLGFFGKNALQSGDRVAEAVAPIITDFGPEIEEYEDEAEEVSLIPEATQGPTPLATPKPICEEPRTAEHIGPEPTAADVFPTEAGNNPQSVANHEKRLVKFSPRRTPVSDANLDSIGQDASLPTTPISTNQLRTAVPSLIRGSLREYQHYGLDWLAGLYASGTNGILADEMGLGKTIQSIALLAHLALEHQQWGPHLIVVPTSVMLNWEVEFKKFLPGFKVLTYYGTQEERKIKRQGWMDQDKWNVWITSYTIVTNDQQIFRRKPWHYMILDEAHNIKNFQSLRWQTLLGFNSRARLLLTGTPLQNNLTELWSLLKFLMPDSELNEGFADRPEFLNWFKRPADQILEHGRDEMDDQSKAIVTKLHKVLRPYLLRRLKADVEKQMPGKYEHVIYCRLSKRQRALYDQYMSLRDTRQKLISGNAHSIMSVLLKLRKVCNHPDLFETRPISTSFAMLDERKSVVADFEIKELLIRRRLLQEDPSNTVDLNLINLLPGANEAFSALDTIQRQRLGALGSLRQLTSQQWGRIRHDLPFDGLSLKGALESYENNVRINRFEDLRHAAYLTSLRSQRRPLYSQGLMEQLRFDIKSLPEKREPTRPADLSDWFSSISPALHKMVLTLPDRAAAMKTTITKFACITPRAVNTDMPLLTLCPQGYNTLDSAPERYLPEDPFHEASVCLSIAFPDKRLLQYDCGKLQKLEALLRDLQRGNHRALIFTQMTRVLDILEQFLNIHGYRYLRLDGATKIEERQVMTERFNSDDRILVFILSSRAGGIGINLTGADSVIFYDQDWNPAMDKQCQDRCHRIGQTRDVHIYRLVSEYTIEANILRKANNKRMLDDVVIQDGQFTTDFFQKPNVKDVINDESFIDGDAEVNEAMDRILGGRGGGKAFEEVEDEEDRVAAKIAEKESADLQDAVEFDEKTASTPAALTTNTSGPATPGEAVTPLPNGQDDAGKSVTIDATESGLVAALPPSDENMDELPSCDNYMMRFVEWELKDIPVQPPIDKHKKKKWKGKEQSQKRR
ncbi:swr1 complex component [Puttea exsequens]|nr:swr1 complex component [Puttea exsequens]